MDGEKKRAAALDTPEGPAWRPRTLAGFTGQDSVRAQLSVMIFAARQGGRALDHILFVGPVGIGKVTLARVVASELRASMTDWTGGTGATPGDLAAELGKVRAGSIMLFEHAERLSRRIVDVLVEAMRDFSLTIVAGDGLAARSLTLRLPRFTVVATTSHLARVDPRMHALASLFRLEPYPSEEIQEIIRWSAKARNLPIEPGAVRLVAQRANGLPGEAIRLLRLAEAAAVAKTNGVVTTAFTKGFLASVE